MTNQPQDTSVVLRPDTDCALDERGYSLLTMTAQQAVLPRKLEEGIYAILDADGAIQIRETEGYAREQLHDWAQARSERPEFVHRSPVLLDVDSFLAYLTANTDSAEGEVGPYYALSSGALEVWADIDSRKVTAILDGFDGLRKHTATLILKTSREWAEWMAIDGKLLPQADFAQFVEDHLSTIAEPDGALLLDICETLTGKTDVAWKSQALGSNGQRQFVYEETVEGKAGPKGNLAIPTGLMLALRPFQGSAAQPVTARFRYRMREGHLTIGVKLAEPESVLEAAFDSVVADVQSAVPVHVNHGRP